MANLFVTIRIIVQIIAILVLMAAIGLTTAAVLSSTWQTFEYPSTGEIHQHGLWIDWNYGSVHASGSQGYTWTWKYKFGAAVEKDEPHRAQPYQVNALILLCVGTFTGIIGLFFSYCACWRLFGAIGWAVCSFIATILCTIGIITFYLTAVEPKNKSVNGPSGENVMVIVGDAFYLAVFGTSGYALCTLLAIFCAVFALIVSKIPGGKSKKTYPTIHHATNTVV